MDFSKMSDIELKALAYDALAQSQNCQATVNAVAQELSNRAKKPAVDPSLEAKEVTTV